MTKAVDSVTRARIAEDVPRIRQEYPVREFQRTGTALVADADVRRSVGPSLHVRVFKCRGNGPGHREATVRHRPVHVGDTDASPLPRGHQQGVEAGVVKIEVRPVSRLPDHGTTTCDLLWGVRLLEYDGRGPLLHDHLRVGVHVPAMASHEPVHGDRFTRHTERCEEEA